MVWNDIDSMFPEKLNDRPTIAMTLTTKIIMNGTPILGLFIQEGAVANYHHLRLGIKNPTDSADNTIYCLGYLGYELRTNALRVGDINNYSAMSGFLCKHVGNALHEIAFRKSIEYGKGGQVCLNSTKKAVFFHFQWGFIPEPHCLDEEVLLHDSNLKELCNQYCKLRVAQQQVKQNGDKAHFTIYENILSQIELKIKEFDVFQLAIKRAQKYLNYSPEDIPSFEMILRTGLYTTEADFLTDYLDAIKLICEERNNQFTDGLLESGSWMVLTENTIMAKKHEFNISSPTSIPRVNLENDIHYCQTTSEHIVSKIKAEEEIRRIVSLHTKPSTLSSKPDKETEEKTYDEWLAMGTTGFKPTNKPKKLEPISQEDIEHRELKMDPIRNMPYYGNNPLPSKPFFSRLLSMIGFHSAPLSKPDEETDTMVLYKLGKSKS